MSRQVCAKYLGVSVRTVRYWDAGRNRVPWAVVRLLRLLRTGDIGGLHDDWKGWYLNPRTAELCSPNGYIFQPYRLAAWNIVCEQARLWRAAYDRARAGGVGASAPARPKAVTLQPEAGEAVLPPVDAPCPPNEAASTLTAFDGRALSRAPREPGATGMLASGGSRLARSRGAVVARSATGLVILSTSGTHLSESPTAKHLLRGSHAG